MTPQLSVVVPVHNEAAHVAATLDALVTAVERSGWDAEVVLVDDGSTDGTAEVAEQALDGRLPFRVLAQANLGRLEARRTGLATAIADMVLLLDGRVRLAPDALAFVLPRVNDGARVWASHVEVTDDETGYGLYWRLIAELAWHEYFRDPRLLSFGVAEFDRFPKGTTALLAPRRLMLDAIDAFRSSYTDPRYANDDTPLLRWVAARERIWIAPEYRSFYTPRTTFARFVRHSFRRGIVFLDGHGRPDSRFFPFAVAFFPASALFARLIVRRPLLAAAIALSSTGAAATAVAGAGYSRREAGLFALVTPVYAAGHGAGMWFGLALAATNRARGLLRREA